MYFRIFEQLKKVISISLLIVLLLGNVGFTYGTHICDGHAVISEVMLGEKPLDCGMAMMEMREASSNDLHISKPPCCENQYVTMEVDEIFKKDVSQQLAPIFVATTVALVLYIVRLDFNEYQPIPADSSPPFLKQDFQAIHQVFLI
ncbi:MAG: hypothetical protein ACJASN_001245 [Cyclobacteriaceae bacterium]